MCAQDKAMFVVLLCAQAKHVAATATNLCDSASSLVQGQASEERLIAAAKAVSVANTQLLVACMVKANPDSDSARRLHVSAWWWWWWGCSVLAS